MARSAANNNELAFEDALARLEELVGALETGDIPLADLVEKYGEGTKLLRNCEGQLTNAELKIEALRESANPSPQPSEDDA